MLKRNQPSIIQTTLRSALEKSGEQAMGPEAITAPIPEVRKAGLKHIGGRILGAAGVGAAAGLFLAAANYGAVKGDENARRINHDRQVQLDGSTQETATLPHVTHEVQADENPSTIAGQYNARPQDAHAMAETIQARYADEKGYIHPGQVIDITPPHPAQVEQE